MKFFNLDIFSEGEATLSAKDNVLCVTERKFRYSSPAVKLDGKNGYKAEILVKSKNIKINLSAYFKVIYNFNGEEEIAYIAGDKIDVTPEEYTKLSATLNLHKGIEVKEVISYIIQNGKEDLDDYFVSSYVINKEEYKDFIKENNLFPEKAPVGAIRWDAYFSTDYVGSNVSREVSKTLSPNIFHSHAPFFAKTVDKDKVVFNEPTQAQFDYECELAVDAGIDYFAYCWYRNNDPMCYARRQHTKSVYRDKIKMCAIIGVSRLDDESIDELSSNCNEDFYFKILGRPVIYVFGAQNTSLGHIKAVEAKVFEKTGKVPYFVAMTDASVLAAFNYKLVGYEALTSYSCFPDGEGWSYQQLVEKADKRNNLFLSYNEIIDTVPHITCGLDFRPRALNPVSWMGGTKYAYTGKAEEIYYHAKKVLSLAKNVPAVLIYAWNEHDEGGWCCPTLTVDENGNTIVDENGNNVMDRSHLDAIKKAIVEYKNELS